VVKRKRGFTLMEVVVSLALFGIFLLIITQMTREMAGYEKRLPVNFMSHPQVNAVLSRLRRDVFDATEPYYPESYETYSQSSKMLILYSLQPTGYAETVVWDFSKSGEVTRRSFSVGSMTSEWVARGVPQFTISDFPVPHHPDSVRIKATDQKGSLAVDQLFQPRPHS
jgi:prepilin-type N-terminal cleavage/methylation domain-containing protein